MCAVEQRNKSEKWTFFSELYFAAAGCNVCTVVCVTCPLFETFACFLLFSKRSTTAKGVWEINSEQLVPILYAFPGTLADYANAVISRFRSRLRHWHNPLVCEERHTRWALGVNCLCTLLLSYWKIIHRLFKRIGIKSRNNTKS